MNSVGSVHLMGLEQVQVFDTTEIMVGLKTKIYFCLNVNGDLWVKTKPLSDMNRMPYVLFSYSVEGHSHGNPQMCVMLFMRVVSLGAIRYPNCG